MMNSHKGDYRRRTRSNVEVNRSQRERGALLRIASHRIITYRSRSASGSEVIIVDLRSKTPNLPTYVYIHTYMYINQR